jgi:hypothetical protein
MRPSKIFRDYEDDADIIRSQVSFLRNLWGELPQGTFTFLAFKQVTTGKWIDHVIEHRACDLADILTEYSRWDHDQYFCPNPFSEPRRKRQYALQTRFGWCDMDASDPKAYDPPASLVWETSPGRFQALWAWDRTHKVSDAEQFSKALAYRHGGDRNGWSATKMLRVPGSVNHKPQYDEPFVRAVSCDWTKIVSRPLPLQGTRHYRPAADIDADPGKHDRDAVLKRYGKDLHPKVRTLIRNRKAYEPDRSAQIFHIAAGLHEAGASPNEIAAVLLDSPYFVEKHGRDINKLNEEIARVIAKLGGGR